jgi:hydrogenase-4 component E
VNGPSDSILVLIVLINLMLLGTSRLGACIRLVAVQGILLGLLALAAPESGPTLRAIFLSGGGMIVKGVIFPWLLSRALRGAGVRREVDPFVGYIPSTLAGVGALGVSMWVASRLPLPDAAASSLVVPVALFTFLTGFFLIVSRRQAVTQVLGYLVLENGVYAFGVALVPETPMLVELGILLDVFVAVFVMGITIFHISREFDHIDTGRLSTLRD